MRHKGLPHLFAVILDYVDGMTVRVFGGCNVLGSRVPSHLGALALERLDKDDSQVGRHVEAISK